MLQQLAVARETALPATGKIERLRHTAGERKREHDAKEDWGQPERGVDNGRVERDQRPDRHRQGHSDPVDVAAAEWRDDPFSPGQESIDIVRSRPCGEDAVRGEALAPVGEWCERGYRVLTVHDLGWGCGR